MIDEELNYIEHSIKSLKNKKSCFRFNSTVEEMKVTGIILICKILFAILKEIKNVR